MFWFVVFCFPLLVYCQVVNVITDPPQISDTESPTVYAIENSTNVSIFCNVTFGNIQLVTLWRLTKELSVDDLDFNINGTAANTDSSNFYVTGEPLSGGTTRANLSILLFDSLLDTALIHCGSGSDLPGEFNLRLLVIPSIPRDLTINNIGVDYVNMSWINPLTLGTPKLTGFKIDVIPSETIITIDALNTLDSDYTNTYTVTGLQPVTDYTITVTVLVVRERVGTVTSDKSEEVLFNTTTGAPKLQSGLLQNVNGLLVISWELVHNGGIKLDNVTILCNNDNNLMVVDYDITSSISIGPVIAGISYSCLVTIANSIGSDEAYTNSIVASTGIPSSPVIISAFIGGGIAYLTIRVQHYGINNTNGFSIVITDNSSSVIMMITPESLTSPFVTVIINETINYTNDIISITTNNTFGVSVNETIIDKFVNIDPFQVVNFEPCQLMATAPSIITTTTTVIELLQYTSEPTGTIAERAVFNNVSVVGSLGAVIILLLIITIVGSLLMIIICFYQRKKTIVKNQKVNNQLVVPVTASVETYEMINRSATNNDDSVQIKTQNNLAYAPITSLECNRNNRVYETVET